jgi:Protein of unknown function (DUF3263)
MDSLTEQQRVILDMERQWWETAGGKDRAIAEQFGISSARYRVITAPPTSLRSTRSLPQATTSVCSHSSSSRPQR